MGSGALDSKKLISLQKKIAPEHYREVAPEQKILYQKKIYAPEYLVLRSTG